MAIMFWDCTGESDYIDYVPGVPEPSIIKNKKLKYLLRLNSLC